MPLPCITYIFHKLDLPLQIIGDISNSGRLTSSTSSDGYTGVINVYSHTLLTLPRYTEKHRQLRLRHKCYVHIDILMAKHCVAFDTDNFRLIVVTTVTRPSHASSIERLHTLVSPGSIERLHTLVSPAAHRMYNGVRPLLQLTAVSSV